MNGDAILLNIDAIATKTAFSLEVCICTIKIASMLLLERLSFFFLASFKLSF